MITIDIRLKDVPPIPVNLSKKYRASLLDVWDTLGGTTEWVQSFIIPITHHFYTGFNRLYFYKSYVDTINILKHGEYLRNVLEDVDVLTLEDDDVVKYKLYRDFISFLGSDDYLFPEESYSFKEAYDGRNRRGSFCEYIVGVDGKDE